MTQKEKFRVLWRYLYAHGPLDCNVDLLEGCGYICTNVLRLYVSEGYTHVISYDVSRFTNCWLDERDSKELLNVAFLYDQILGDLHIDHNLF